MILTKKDIKRHPNSSTTLFYHKDKLYRAINKNDLPFLDDVINCKYMQPCVKTDLKLRWGKELRTVIEHPIIKHMSKIQELTAKQSLKQRWDKGDLLIVCKFIASNSKVAKSWLPKLAFRNVVSSLADRIASRSRRCLAVLP